LNIYLR